MNRLMGGCVLGLLLALAVPGRAFAEEDEDEEDARPRGEGAMYAPGGLYDTGTHERKPMLSVYGILPWWYGFGFGAGARYGIPVVPDGFIPSLNDSFEVEAGGDIWYGNYGVFSANYSYVGLAIPVEGKWTFHFTPEFSAYGKLGLGWSFNFWSDDFGTSDVSGGGFYWDTAFGGLYKVSENLSLRGEVGYAGLRAGISLTF